MVLLTGCTSAIGRFLLHALTDKGYHVLGVGRHIAKLQILRNLGFSCLNLDLTEAKNYQKLPPCQYIIHAAALSAPWGAYSEFYRQNVLSTQNLATWAEANSVSKIIYISSASVYARNADAEMLKEHELPTQFVNYYAQTKYLAEQILGKQDIETVILRPRALIGAGDAVLMPRILRAYHSNKLRRVSGYSPLTDVTSLENLAHAVWLALHDAPATQHRIFNVHNGETIALWVLINNVLEALKLQPVSKTVPFGVLYGLGTASEWWYKLRKSQKEPAITRYGAITLTRSLTLDIDAIREALHYKPLVSTQYSVEQFVSWQCRQMANDTRFFAP